VNSELSKIKNGERVMDGRFPAGRKHKFKIQKTQKLKVTLQNYPLA
jgi:hypothetical protein